MRHLMAAAGCALALACGCALANDARGAGNPGAARAALWRTYDMIVDLRNLPRTYTCDQLWYEFDGVLLRLGAWPYTINILPYHCSPSPSGAMRSPDVQVRFQLPFFLHGVAAKAAPAEAIEGTIRLAPGEPKTLGSSDCELMQQISQSLLASIPARVDEEHFDCSGSEQRAAHFNVTVTLPMGVKIPPVPATAARGPR
jgi:hypothetical protein